MRRLLILGVTISVAVSAAPAIAATDYAPLNRPGPALTVPAADLAESLQCSTGVENATRIPVLLIHGTGANSDINWSWNHIPELDELGIPWCTVDLPVGGTGDIQFNAEFIVNAIRETYSRSGRRIAIIGHSQGGSAPRWALRFWPDTRKMVDDMIGYAPPNHGSTGADLTCGEGQSCSPSTYQFRTSSNFNAALNSRTETFAGISYTNVYSHTDFIATPSGDDSGTTALHVGEGQITNVAIQDICPLQTTEHLGLAYDPVAWALAFDAIASDGPAQESRIGSSVCAQVVMPGVNPATFAADVARAVALYAAFPSVPDVDAEPPLRCYALKSGCAEEGGEMRIVSRRLLMRGSRTAVRVRCSGLKNARCEARLRIRHAGRTLASKAVGLVAKRTTSVRLALVPAPRRAQRVRVEVRSDGTTTAHARLPLRVR